MNGTNRIALTALALVLAAGLGFAAARYTAPSSAGEAHADEHAEAGHEEGGAHAEGEEGFVALPLTQAPAAGVTVVSVAVGSGGELLLPGRVAFAPNAAAAVGAPAEGTVERVHVAAGDRVTRGAALVTLRSAQAASAGASLGVASAEAEAARAALARERRLLDAGVVALQDFEAARAASLKADAELAAARAQVAALGSPNTADTMTVRSPIAGTVTSVTIAPGAVVAAGAPLAEVADPSRVELVFDAPAAAARTIRPEARLLAMRADGDEVMGAVTAGAPAAGGTSAIVRARPLGPVPPAGTPVSARVSTAGGSGLVVPAEAVQSLEGRPVVFVAETKGFRAQPVVPGRAAAGRVEILRGVEAGARIAGKGAFLLKAELGKGEAEHAH